jgi:hypothetical protein
MSVLLAIGIAIVLALPIAWRVARGRFDPFEPIVLFALAWGVMFVVRPIAIVVRDDTNFYGVDIAPTLDKAVLLGLLGAVAFIAGYELVVSTIAGRVPRAADAELSSPASWLAMIVGLLATFGLALFLWTSAGAPTLRIYFGGRSDELNGVLQDSTLYLWSLSLAVVPAALVGFAVAYTRRTPGTILAAIVTISLALIRVVPTGSRMYLLVLVGGALVFVYLHHARRPTVVAALLGLALALAASYVVLNFRYADTREIGPTLKRVASTPTRVLSPLVKGPDAEMAPALAGALLVIPSELPYRYGAATFGDLVSRPIPRQLWEGKPKPHTIVVTEAVWPVARETGDFQPTSTPLLSFYWDFGLLGAFLGLALYGVLARALYEYLLAAPGSARAQLVYALGVWTLVIALRVDPVLLVIHSVIMFVPLIVILSLAPRLAFRGSVKLFPANGSGRGSRLRPSPVAQEFDEDE